ncbi:MAG TPA: DUF47 family protein [Limnochordia bacterium]
MRRLRGLWRRLNRPRIDFFALLREHAQAVFEAVAALRRWLDERSDQAREGILSAERRADQIVERIEQELDRAFSTPFDREDIHAIAFGFDEVADYAKATVREMEILEVGSDDFVGEMLDLLIQGSDHIIAAIEALERAPRAARDWARQAKKVENAVEIVYRNAVRALFEGREVIEILKRREIYRHLSNAADKLDRVADVIAMAATKLG